MNCISVSDMHSKNSEKCKVNSEQCKNTPTTARNIFSVIIHHSLFLIFFLITHHSLLITAVNAEVIERIVAVVDDDAITLSEFDNALQTAVNPEAKTDVLNGMINRILLLRQAKKFKLEDSQAADDNALINDYIEKRLKALIRISPEEIEPFYEKNKKSFGDKDFYDARNEIETYLIEKELNRKLLEHIKELREKSYIRIQMENENPD
ncbi:MAG: hypothetical protein HZC11_00320 [Nitrospirae bacterium]|nr:hypothetical protein [Nitrospirota bacterium]